MSEYMWHTPLGARYLAGREPERSLFRYSLRGLVQSLENGSEIARTGVQGFDRLDRGHQVIAISIAANHLLSKTLEPKPLTMVLDAAAGVPVIHLMTMVRTEMRLDEAWHRDIVMTVAGDMGLDTGDAERDFQSEAAWARLVDAVVCRLAWRVDNITHERLRAVAVPGGQFCEMPRGRPDEAKVQSALTTLSRLVGR